MHIRTGYWLDGDEYFEILSDTDHGDIFPLLHGFCPVFASALSDTFGYRVLGAFIYDYEVEDQGLVHAFCETPEGFLVDVRGMTDDWEAFLVPFEDEFSFSDELDVREFDLSGFEDEEMHMLSCEVISSHPDYYSFQSR